MLETRGRRRTGNTKRSIFRNNLRTILDSSTAYPFKHKNGVFHCFFCNTKFSDPEKLREHNRSLHGDTRKFAVSFTPNKYEPIKIDFGEAACRICGVPVTNYGVLKAHILAEHGKEIDTSYGETILPYSLDRNENKCQVCGKSYELFLTLHRHLNEHYNDYICENCGKRFATRGRMFSHSKTHSRQDWPCRKCDKKFATYSALRWHDGKEHECRVMYSCPICEERFTSYLHRMKHLSSVHGQETIYACPSCPKVFKLCSLRTAHIKFAHKQERNHECTTCGMKFFTNRELKNHEVKHSGARIYQCDVCKKSYARMKTLREHMRIHNNDRRFACQVCGQAFVQNCSLKLHLRVHHALVLKSEAKE